MTNEQEMLKHCKELAVLLKDCGDSKLQADVADLYEHIRIMVQTEAYKSNKYRLWLHFKDDVTGETYWKSYRVINLEWTEDGQLKATGTRGGKGSITMPVDGKKAILERCIGIQDRNGTDIYEGDLLGESDNLLEVCWSNSLASFMVDKYPTTDGNLDSCHKKEPSKLVIVGNIHEYKAEV